MDVQNIEELIQRMNQDDVKELLVDMSGSVITSMERDLIDEDERLLSRSPDCPTLRKRECKNQEKLSMFYAGKKRRKGGRYA